MCRFLWYVLRERKFDDTAIEDLVCLKEAMHLANDDVACALLERCVRIEKKYGNLMLQTEGVPHCCMLREFAPTIAVRALCWGLESTADWNSNMCSTAALSSVHLTHPAATSPSLQRALYRRCTVHAIAVEVETAWVCIVERVCCRVVREGGAAQGDVSSPLQQDALPRGV
jgi:hypothetical protein